MRFKEKEITLRDGRKCVLCPTPPERAQDMIDYLKKNAREEAKKPRTKCFARTERYVPFSHEARISRSMSV